jgi:molybdate transport system regulatory protein
VVEHHLVGLAADAGLLVPAERRMRRIEVVAASLFLRIDLNSHGHIGPGKIDLLEQISERGSIAAAGRAMSMSYRRAWELVEEMNATFGRPVVQSRTGGKSGGGAELTPLGYLVLGRYRAMQKAVGRASETHLSAIQAELKAKRT